MGVVLNLELDTRFGSVRPAGGHGVRPWEWQGQPRSLIRIDPELYTRAETRALLSFMIAAQSACVATCYLCGSVTLLWLVDGSGLIRLAVEEALLAENWKETVPMLRNHREATSGLGKLGHPALLDDDKRARIGGELLMYFPPLAFASTRISMAKNRSPEEHGAMTLGFEPVLDRIRRLGKAERQQWREILKDVSPRIGMQERIAQLLGVCHEAGNCDLEDIFIFGAQIADIWPTDELVLAVDDITAITAAFAQGFKGEAFETCFDDRVLDTLRESSFEASEQLPRRSRTNNAGSLTGQAARTRTLKLPTSHAAA